MSANLSQKIALNEEVLTCIRLLESGLGALQRIDGANDFYHLPMLTLASGFERLMKVIICLYNFSETGSFQRPARIPTGRDGHDLEKLLEIITEQCFRPKYIKSIPAAREDVEYLRSDQRLKEIVALLSKFGQAARYHHLDIILGRNPITLAPEREWESMEMAILKEIPGGLERLTTKPSDINAIYREINHELVVRFERLGRALVRLFTLGDLGDIARQQTGIIGPFLFLKDSDLGTRKY